MESWIYYQGMKVPLMEQVTVINKIFWGLQKLDDGYNIYTDFPLQNKPMKGIRCCMYIDADPKYTMEFYSDDKGNHLGTVTENGHENFPFPDQEPFASCFADRIDMSTARPVPPEKLAELNSDCSKTRLISSQVQTYPDAARRRLVDLNFIETS